MRELVFRNKEQREQDRAQNAAQEAEERKKKATELTHASPLLSEKTRLEEMLARPDNGPMFCTLVQAQLDRINEELKGVATQ